MLSKIQTKTLLTLLIASLFYFVGISSVHAQETTTIHSAKLNQFNTSAGVAAMTQPGTSVASHSQLSSGVQFTPLSFNAFGMRWNGRLQHADDVRITVDLYHQGAYVDTVDLPHIGNHVKTPLADNTQVTQPAVVPVADAFEVHMTLHNHNGAPVSMNDIEFLYYDTRDSGDTVTAQNTTDESNGAVQPADTSSSSSTVDIVSRSKWGANEDLRFKKNGEPIWPQEFKKISHVIVHHTAASDGGDTPAATVRAIYEWHTQTLKWGDIGYNFLIAPNGKIYKGRKGKVKNGVGVVGGHTFNSSTNTDFNPNTVGIALLGCYEQSSSCATSHKMTSKMRKSLKRLIASIAKGGDFEPKSRAKLRGEQRHRILGHRSVDSTLCPGNHVFEDLSTIRTEAQQQYNKIAKKKYQGKITQATVGEQIVEDETEIEIGQPYTVTVSYKNTGRKAWKQKKTFLKVYSDDGKTSTTLRHKSWEDRLGRIAMNEETVQPGETATFSVRIRTPKSAQDIQLVTKLFHSKSKVAKSNGTIDLRFIQSWVGALASTTFPVGAYASSTQRVELEFINMGQKKWREGVRLYMNGKEVGRFDDIVRPGEAATINFPFTAAKKSGVKEYKLQLKRKNGTRITGTRHIRLVAVE